MTGALTNRSIKGRRTHPQYIFLYIHSYILFRSHCKFFCSLFQTFASSKSPLIVHKTFSPNQHLQNTRNLRIHSSNFYSLTHLIDTHRSAIVCQWALNRMSFCAGFRVVVGATPSGVFWLSCCSAAARFIQTGIISGCDGHQSTESFQHRSSDRKTCFSAAGWCEGVGRVSAPEKSSDIQVF